MVIPFISLPVVYTSRADQISLANLLNIGNWPILTIALWILEKKKLTVMISVDPNTHYFEVIYVDESISFHLLKNTTSGFSIVLQCFIPVCSISWGDRKMTHPRSIQPQIRPWSNVPESFGNTRTCVTESCAYMLIALKLLMN
jgi:hypothetical protein